MTFTWQERKFSKYHQNRKVMKMSSSKMTFLMLYPTWKWVQFTVLMKVVLLKQLLTKKTRKCTKRWACIWIPTLLLKCYIHYQSASLPSWHRLYEHTCTQRSFEWRELLLFSEEAANLTRTDGWAALETGDTVVMDNCGFHHGHFVDVEPVLPDLLADCGVGLIFQPPHSPEFNTFFMISKCSCNRSSAN